MKKGMKIRIKILNPIHIGSGEEISPLEYFVDKEKGFFHRLNMDTLFSDQGFRPYFNKFIKEAISRRYIGDIIQDKSLLQRHILYSLPISAEARPSLLNRPANIKTFIKSAGRVYLPGSSLKGSILSALLWFVLKEEYFKMSNEKRSKIQNLLSSRRGDQKAFDDLLEFSFPLISPVTPTGQEHEDVARKSKDHPKFLPWLDISDSSMKRPQECLKINLAHVEGARRGGQIPIYYECLKEGQVFETEICCDPICRFSEKEVLDIVHEFYSQVAKKDGVKFDSEIRYLLRLGQGSTAYSTSLLLLAESLGIKNYMVKPPRTRKRIGEIPMGFVEISPVS